MKLIFKYNIQIIIATDKKNITNILSISILTSKKPNSRQVFFPIKPDLKNSRATHPFHRCYWSLKAEPSRHQSQIKICVHLQL